MRKSSAVYASGESFDMGTNDTAAIEDVDGSALEAYARAVGSEPDIELLSERGFLAKGRLTNAGVLLLASEPGRHIARSEIAVEARFGAGKGRHREGERLDRVFDMPLALALPAIRSYVAELLGPERDAKGEGGSGYPCHAWLEGLVNAVAHRDYGMRGDPTSLSVLEGRIEVTSAGGLPCVMTLENMRRSRYSRNPALARALTELGWMHELGVGVRGIYASMGEPNVRYDEIHAPEGSYLRLTLVSRKQGIIRDSGAL